MRYSRVCRRQFVAAGLMSLITLCGLTAANAAGPDGFANVQWGASRAQVAQAMAQQGFNAAGDQLGAWGGASVNDCYLGSLANVRGHLCFGFMNGVFFVGSFLLEENDGGDAENAAWATFSSIIQAKYGPPTRTWGPEDNLQELWSGLLAPGSSDVVEISIHFTTEKAPYASTFGTLYLNRGLQQRLAGQNKNGL